MGKWFYIVQEILECLNMSDYDLDNNYLSKC